MWVLWAGKRDEVAHAHDYKATFETFADAQQAAITDYRDYEAVVVIAMVDLPREGQAFSFWFERVGDHLESRPR